ncbi:MAG TPA: hypothetical protein DCZ56_03750, partial [Sutterella sp.]|nr:hypothetical protein [Sutterella sp.]
FSGENIVFSKLLNGLSKTAQSIEQFVQPCSKQKLRSLSGDSQNREDSCRYTRGPRQVGKTTAALQAMDRLALPHLFFSADNVLGGSEWIAQRWQEARLAMEQSAEREFVIAFDEIQKTANWSEAVKRQRRPLEALLPMPIARLLA